MKRYSSYKDSGIAWAGLIPAHWDVSRVASLYTENTSKNTDNEFAFAMRFNYGTLVDKNETGDVSDLKETYSAYTKVKKNDVVINGLNLNYDFNSLRVAISPKDGIITSAYIIMTPRPGTNSTYYNYLFKSMDSRKIFHGMGTGIRLTLSFAELKKQALLVPPADEQEAIVRYITEKSEKIDRYIAEQERLLAALNELRQAEIARAVTRGLNSDAPLRDSGIDWIGTIPAHWDIEPMGRHFEFSKGLTITKANLTPTGVAVISYGQIHNRANSGVSISQDLVRYVPETYLETNSECLLRPNDFIFADTSEDIEGSGNCAFNDYADNIFAGYHTVIARPLDLEYPKYTAYLFQSKPWKEQVHQNVNAVKVYSINRTILKKTTILIPPLDEQRAIVEYLNEKTAKIDRMKADIEKQIGLLKEYKQRMISDAVTGKIDVRE